MKASFALGPLRHTLRQKSKHMQLIVRDWFCCVHTLLIPSCSREATFNRISQSLPVNEVCSIVIAIAQMSQFTSVWVSAWPSFITTVEVPLCKALKNSICFNKKCLLDHLQCRWLYSTVHWLYWADFRCKCVTENRAFQKKTALLPSKLPWSNKKKVPSQGSVKVGWSLR